MAWMILPTCSPGIRHLIVPHTSRDSPPVHARQRALFLEGGLYTLKEVQVFSQQAVEARVQHRQSTQLARLQALGARSGHDAARGARGTNVTTGTASGGWS